MLNSGSTATDLPKGMPKRVLAPLTVNETLKLGTRRLRLGFLVPVRVAKIPEFRRLQTALAPLHGPGTDMPSCKQHEA